jgi:hypothetical protein
MHQCSRAKLVSLRDVSAGLEDERARAFDMALSARNHQRSPAIPIRLCDISASLEKRAHAPDSALVARSQQRSVDVRRVRLRDVGRRRPRAARARTRAGRASSRGPEEPRRLHHATSALAASRVRTSSGSSASIAAKMFARAITSASSFSTQRRSEGPGVRRTPMHDDDIAHPDDRLL